MVGVLRASVVFQTTCVHVHRTDFNEMTDDSHEDVWMKNPGKKRNTLVKEREPVY